MNPFEEEDIEDVRIIIKAKGKNWSLSPMDGQEDRALQVRKMCLMISLHSHFMVTPALEDIKIIRMERKWFKPANRPEYSKELDHTSVNVLIYSFEMDIHVIGFFDFSADEWKVFAEEDFGNSFLWSYLEKPKTMKDEVVY